MARYWHRPNGHQHINEVVALINEAVRAVTGRDRADVPFPFTLETGAALLSASFAEVTKHEHVELVRVPRAEPIIAYITSFGPEHVGICTPAEWEDLLAAAAELVRARIRRDGEFPVTSHTGHRRGTQHPGPLQCGSMASSSVTPLWTRPACKPSWRRPPTKPASRARNR